MKYQIKCVHLVGKGGTGTSRKQGPAAYAAVECDRPRAESAAEVFVRIRVGIAR